MGFDAHVELPIMEYYHSWTLNGAPRESHIMYSRRISFGALSVSYTKLSQPLESHNFGADRGEMLCVKIRPFKILTSVPCNARTQRRYYGVQFREPTYVDLG